MDNRSNDILFDKGMKKAKELVSGYIFDVLTKCCEDLIQDALDNKSGFRNLTGNTITSYACGLFMDGRFSYFICSGDSMKQPVRVKLTKGETLSVSVMIIRTDILPEQWKQTRVMVRCFLSSS